MLFSDRGVLQGLLTKKDVWYVLNGAEESRKVNAQGGVTINTGITREDGQGEERGLLNREEERDDALHLNPGDDDIPIL